MGFREIVSAPAIGLGGVNKKTGKANPTKVEGYFLRSREIPDNKKKTGISLIHDFLTKTGEVAVWGKTDLDRKLQSVMPGTMTRVTFTGKTRPTPNGEMILFTVESDPDNTMEVAPAPEAGEEPAEDDTGTYESGEAEEAAVEEEESPVDEVTPPRAQPPKQAATTDAARAAKVKALLANKKAS